MNKNLSKKYLSSSLAFAMSASLGATENPQIEDRDDAIGLERIIVTGVTQGTRVMDSSVSVSTVTPDELEVSSPRTAAEAFRIIPGIKVESTGGEGNANIAVRGLPVAAGGSKFLQIQEDGLPILQFGDIAFANADIFLRLDSTMATIESIRGGSASTLASNAPGGIINVISKTGESDSGSIATTYGVDYDSFRTDFEYGSDINDTTRFHIGGFVRDGEGSRNTGYTSNSGGQLKANLTKEFDTGYVRLYFKHLNDKTVSYLPMPMYADGRSIAGFNASSDAIQSAYFLSTHSLGGDGEMRNGDMRNGMNPLVNSLGLEASFELENNWLIENRFRYSEISGNFLSPFPAQVASSNDIATSIGGEGATLVYANGPQAGATMSNDALAMRIHTFDVSMDDLSSIVNDFKLIKVLDDTSVTLGYYNSMQTIAMSWMWNSYVMELKGDNAALLNVVGVDGTQYSDNGLYAYGVPYWDNCCQRKYDVDYTIRAPYLAVSTQLGDFSFDASARYDSGDATGYYASTVQSEIDMNQDGNISVPEMSVSSVNNANPMPVNYGWNYMSYSFGVNYSVAQNLALFARSSHGGRVNADRLLYGKVNDDGSVSKQDAVDFVDQYELGVKYRLDALSLFATTFYAETEEQNFEATSQDFFDRKYEAKGIELEAAYYIGDFDFRGNVTWTDAEITKDGLNADSVGNTPRRQADYIYTLMGQYNFDLASIGLSLIGTTASYAQDNIVQDDDALKFDGYNQVNAFASYILTEGLTVSLNVNNLFNATGITEAEEGVVSSADDIIRARTINGRTTSATLKYDF
ncbi:TonB-dependent receptor [uncultured Shewanella sp.]|uniref:TonB-dependent receptor domain-containing protein n=1 Tax=uncultured Shewanella sp. TaxID=173975 RepID=UPI0026201F1B|nr:TonB-dependent receptor [uncultured Shewanella sp.]